MDSIFRSGLVKAVKDASAKYADLPGYEQKVQEHVDMLEKLFEKMGEKEMKNERSGHDEAIKLLKKIEDDVEKLKQKICGEGCDGRYIIATQDPGLSDELLKQLRGEKVELRSIAEITDQVTAQEIVANNIKPIISGLGALRSAVLRSNINAVMEKEAELAKKSRLEGMGEVPMSSGFQIEKDPDKIFSRFLRTGIPPSIEYIMSQLWAEEDKLEVNRRHLEYYSRFQTPGYTQHYTPKAGNEIDETLVGRIRDDIKRNELDIELINSNIKRSFKGATKSYLLSSRDYLKRVIRDAEEPHQLLDRMNLPRVNTQLNDRRNREVQRASRLIAHLKMIIGLIDEELAK